MSKNRLKLLLLIKLENLEKAFSRLRMEFYFVNYAVDHVRRTSVVENNKSRRRRDRVEWEEPLVKKRQR